jgi:hypothetical protein
MGRQRRGEPNQQALGWVKPGEPLAYVEALTAQNAWPPSKATRSYDGPTATSYLVVPASQNDLGVRPLPGTDPLHNASLQLLDPGGTMVVTANAGVGYRVRCGAVNLGVVAAYGGLADFYVAAPSDLDNAARTPRTTLPALGRTGFVAAPGETVTIECPSTWTPQTDAEATNSILVHVHDPLLDPLVHPFDARADRHVGRFDHIPDFAGIWLGTKTLDGADGEVTEERLVITQRAFDVTVEFYEQYGPDLPVNPQLTTNGQIVASRISLQTADPFPKWQQAGWSSQWEITLLDTDTLHVDQYRSDAVSAPRAAPPASRVHPEADLTAEPARAGAPYVSGRGHSGHPRLRSETIE